MNIPIHKVNIQTRLKSGIVNVGIVEKIPMERVEMLLGNDLAGRRVKTTRQPERVKMPRVRKENFKIRNAITDIIKEAITPAKRWKEEQMKKRGGRLIREKHGAKRRR